MRYIVSICCDVEGQVSVACDDGTVWYTSRLGKDERAESKQEWGWKQLPHGPVPGTQAYEKEKKIRRQMALNPTPFPEWWKQLRALADADPNGDIIGSDQEVYRLMWEGEYTPEEAFEEAYSKIV